MMLFELEDFLKDKVLPEEIRIGQHEVIKDVPLMIQSHLKILKANSGKRIFLPYYNRLMMVVGHIKENSAEN